MTWVAAAIGGAAVLGYMGSQGQASAAESAASQQAAAAGQAQQLQKQMFDQQMAALAPYRAAGYSSLNQILGGLQGQQPVFDTQGNITGYTGGTGQFTTAYPAYKPFTAADLKTNLAPNYQFMLEQGLGATRQGMNVAGGGSNVTRAATKFAEDYASNAYQNALSNYMAQQAQGYNQYQTTTGNIYNRLANIAGLGQASQQQATNLAGNVAGNIGQLGVGAATALGAGQIGAAGAQAQGLQGIGNAAMMYGLMRPGGTSLGTMAGGITPDASGAYTMGLL